MRKQYKTVGIPIELAEKAEKYLKEEGYVSLGELVRDLLRNWLREKEKEIWKQLFQDLKITAKSATRFFNKKEE